MADPLARALRTGRERWGDDWRPTLVSSAPGRVELLGNHIDYSGGPVLAAAIDRRAVVLIEPSRDAAVDLAFADAHETMVIDPEALRDWRSDSGSQTSGSYASGVVAALSARGRMVRGGRMVLASDVPIGIGVSSSAAICVALALALTDDDVSPQELVLIAQDAEHRAGTPCGTMDQSASVAGGVILFDGATLGFERLQPALGDVAFLVIDSGVHRALSSSAYPVRVEECRRALAWLHSIGQPVDNLAQVTSAQLAGLRPETGDQEVLIHRLRHIVGEVDRVRQGMTALAGPDWDRFGQLMTASGKSSAGDYAISHPVVESIVARLLTDPQVLGARMMGGGEGGSLIALVRHGHNPEVRERITALVNSDLPQEARPREVYAFAFSEGAGSTLCHQ